jgi:hypothetical protein
MQCAHDICECVVQEGSDFCSDACSVASGGGTVCPCGHEECSHSEVTATQLEP